MPQSGREASPVRVQDINHPEQSLEIIRSKTVLSVEEYLYLLELAKDNDLARKMVLAKLEEPIKQLPLVMQLSASDVDTDVDKRNPKKSNKSKVATKVRLTEKKYSDLLELREDLFPNFETILQNWHNYIIAILTTPDLAKRQLYLSYVIEHFERKLSIYQVLELLNFVQEQVQNTEHDQRTLTNEQDWEKNSPRFIGDLMSVILGLIASHNVANAGKVIDSLFNNTKAVSSKMRAVYERNRHLLRPMTKRIILTNGERVENGVGKESTTYPGFIASAVSGVKDYWSKGAAPSGSPFDAFRISAPESPDWLGDWSQLPFNRVGLPVGIEGLNILPLSNQMKVVVLPVENHLPVVMFVRNDYLVGTDGAQSQSDNFKIIMDFARDELAVYQRRPSLAEADYLSGISTIDLLLAVSPERYKLSMPDQALALAKIGCLTLTRGGREFKFSTVNPQEKKIYELGIRTLLLKKLKSDSNSKAMVEVEVVFAGNIQVSFNLLDNGNMSNFKQSFGDSASARTIDWLRNLAIGYLGQFEIVKMQSHIPTPKEEKAPVHDGNLVSAGESEIQHSDTRGFRVMLNNLPNLGGQWLNSDSIVNFKMIDKLGIDLPILNNLFIKLQAALPVMNQVVEATIDQHAAAIITDELQLSPGDQETVVTLLKLLWLRANKILTAIGVEGKRVRAPLSKRLQEAINKAMLGEEVRQVLEKNNQVFTVTYVEGEESTKKITYHLPEIAESIFGDQID